MPTAHQGFLTDIIDKVIEINPTSVLDIGCGFGKWGFLCREYLDVRMFNYLKNEWKVKIDCIEVWWDYIKPTHEYVYNKIIIGDAYNEILKVDNYDLIIACDIIEHLEKPKALELIERIKKKCKHIIITLPLGTEWGTQGAINGNINETHRSEWDIDDLKGFENKVIDINGKRLGMFTC